MRDLVNRLLLNTFMGPLGGACPYSRGVPRSEGAAPPLLGPV